MIGYYHWIDDSSMNLAGLLVVLSMLAMLRRRKYRWRSGGIFVVQTWRFFGQLPHLDFLALSLNKFIIIIMIINSSQLYLESTALAILTNHSQFLSVGLFLFCPNLNPCPLSELSSSLPSISSTNDNTPNLSISASIFQSLLLIFCCYTF